MEKILEVVVSLIPSLIVIVITYIFILMYILIKKYITTKTEYYEYKLTVLKNKDKLS